MQFASRSTMHFEIRSPNSRKMSHRIGFFTLARRVLISPSEAMEMKAPISATTQHIFAIKVLDRLPGLFKPNRYLYHCARCKWSFVVNNGRRGVITPVDDDGKPLAHDEALKRAATFALGPCPVLQVLNFEPGPIQTSNGTQATRIDRTRRSEPRAN
jgi:hypothetical protein